MKNITRERPETMPGHDPCQVANYFIERGLAAGQPLTPIQINKLAFFAHGWMLAMFQRPLIQKEFEAWAYGPIMPAIYHCLSYYGGEPATQPILARELPFDQDETNILDQVYAKYAGLSGIRLATLAHPPGGPWDRTWRRHKRHAAISNESLRKHFAESYRRYTAK